MKNIWTQEKTKELVKMWKDGHSGSYIAKMLGRRFTRCAVLGKVFRLGIQRKNENNQ